MASGALRPNFSFVSIKVVKVLFKRLQWKIIAMFVLLVLSVMIITGTISVSSLGSFYAQRFADDMDAVFTDSMVQRDLSAAASSENAPQRIAEIIEAYADAGRLGINQNRDYMIFDAKSCPSYISSTFPVSASVIPWPRAPNIPVSCE